jgi:hypothetical protein
VKHLRLDDKFQIEWVGEKSGQKTSDLPAGEKKEFDSVVLAVGFGLERESHFSYWRNETLGQPELDLGKRTYLVSGQGDGALVDLFRIRISRFRQDRILVDLFENDLGLIEILAKVKRSLDLGQIDPEQLYEKFEKIAADESSGFKNLLDILRRRLRADTAAILQTSKKVDSFKKVFSTPASFQNRFLLYALYRAGGFIPTLKDRDGSICEEYGIKQADIIRRHGTDRLEAIKDVLDKALLQKLQSRLDSLASCGGGQPNNILWKGGYWHETSPKLHGIGLEADKSKAKWRVEHLPSATEVLVTGFIAAVAGYIDSLGSAAESFRVTLHRTLFVGPEATLQQAARYVGPIKRLGDPRRTFEFDKGTIGYAATIKQAVRSRQRDEGENDDEYGKALREDMVVLDVERHSQPNPDVRSVLALPIFGPRLNIVAVLYADSTKCNVFTDECVTVINRMCQRFASVIGGIASDRVANFSVPAGEIPTALPFDPRDLKVTEAVPQKLGEIQATADYLNLEFTDFVTLQKRQN